MIEFISHIISAVITAVVIIILVHLLNRQERYEKYHITCEYMHFRYSYNKMDECIAELSKLSAAGWEIATCAGDDSFAVYLILKRDTLHTT